MKGYLNKRKMSKSISDAFLPLCAVAVYIYPILKALTHLECRQLSEYNEDAVKSEKLLSVLAGR